MAIKLPKREYFTFSELAQHWKCNENDIRRLVISKQLIPSFLINHVARLVRLIESEEEGEKNWVPQLVENENYHLHNGDEDQAKFKYKLVLANGFYYLLHPWQTAPLSCQFLFFSKDRDHKEDSGDTCLMRIGKGENGEPITLDQVLREGAVMSSEVERFESESVKMQMESLQILEKPLGTTERNYLLKLVIGMAVTGYKYDPAAKKSTTTKEIADDLADLGIDIDPDTVRKYLKEGANTVLPAKTR